MRSDRYRNVVLTVIAVTLVVIASPPLEPPEVMAASGQADVKAAGVIAGELQDPTGTHTGRALAGPLRWTIGSAMAWDSEIAGDNECITSITLVSMAPSNVSVDVVFLDDDGFSVGTDSFSLATGNPHTSAAVAGSGNIWPLGIESFVNTGHLVGGFARVYAEDPRILATAFLQCKDGGTPSGGGSYQDVRSHANIPAHPVGATAEYFVAGMPAIWTPPVAVPELPE